MSHPLDESLPLQTYRSYQLSICQVALEAALVLLFVAGAVAECVPHQLCAAEAWPLHALFNIGVRLHARDSARVRRCGHG